MLIKPLLDALWPTTCAACDGPIRNGCFCLDCAQTLVPGCEACCSLCGQILIDRPAGPPATCGSCLLHPPPFRRARASFAYGGALQRAIVRWKNDRRTILSRQLVALMTGQAKAAGWTELDRDVIVIPVPTPFRRALGRGFNPAGHLARGLARHLDLPCRPKGLTLAMGVGPSKGLGRGLRRKRLQRAFGAGPWVGGRDLLLVDDVRTTGATLHAAATALKRAGARSVEVALLAAVLS